MVVARELVEVAAGREIGLDEDSAALFSTRSSSPMIGLSAC